MRFLVDEALQDRLAERLADASDDDFGTILALSGAGGPSVLLLPGTGDKIDERLRAILAAGPRHTGHGASMT